MKILTIKINPLKIKDMGQRIEEQVRKNLDTIAELESKVAELVGVLQDLDELTESAEEGSGLDMIRTQVCRTLGQYSWLEGLFEEAEYKDFF